MVGAAPKSMLLVSRSVSSTMSSPMTTISDCVARSTTASVMLTRLDSRRPTMLIAPSATVTAIAAITLAGKLFNPDQKTDRYPGTASAEIAIVTT